MLSPVSSVQVRRLVFGKTGFAEQEISPTDSASIRRPPPGQVREQPAPGPKLQKTNFAGRPIDVPAAMAPHTMHSKRMGGEVYFRGEKKTTVGAHVRLPDRSWPRDCQFVRVT